MLPPALFGLHVSGVCLWPQLAAAVGSQAGQSINPNALDDTTIKTLKLHVQHRWLSLCCGDIVGVAADVDWIVGAAGNVKNRSGFC